MSDKENALDRLLEVLNSEPPTGEVYSMRSSQLAVLWPTLAAALADVMQAHELPPARGLRAAALVVRADRAQNAAADTESGAWCLCLNGPNEDGRGHLKGEQGCSRWCGCQGAAYPHQHDGTMPGNPVIT
jgi:hypothetical protein